MSKELASRQRAYVTTCLVVAALAIAAIVFRYGCLRATTPIRFQLGMVMDESAMAGSRSLPVHDVTLSPFELAAAEVNHASFVQFLNDALQTGAILPPAADRGGLVEWHEDNSPSFPLCSVDPTEPNCGFQFDHAAQRFLVTTNGGVDMADYPVVLVSWYGAALFANWLSTTQGLSRVYDTRDGSVIAVAGRDGWRLPTEAEWEYSATWSPTGKHVYAWGNDWNPDMGNVASSSRPARRESEPFTVAVSIPAPWTKTSEGQNKHLHMTGNVWEWCQDWYEDYSAASVTNPSGAATGTVKVVRGGSFRSYDESAWAGFRGVATPETMTRDIGFRLARSRDSD